MTKRKQILMTTLVIAFVSIISIQQAKASAILACLGITSAILSVAEMVIPRVIDCINVHNEKKSSLLNTMEEDDNYDYSNVTIISPIKSNYQYLRNP